MGDSSVQINKKPFLGSNNGGGLQPFPFSISDSPDTWSVPWSGIPPSFVNQGPKTGFTSGNFMGQTIDDSTEVDLQKDQYVKKIKIAALSDNAQMQYTQGHPLFVKHDRRTLELNTYTTYAIQNANYMLEESKRRKIQIENYGMKQTSLKRTTNDTAVDEFPSDVKSFINNYGFIGYFQSGGSLGRVREYTAGYAYKSEIETANIFGDVKTNRMVGYAITTMENPYTSFYDFNGMNRGPPTEGQITQIVGCYEQDEKYQIHCSDTYGVPNKTKIMGLPFDLDFEDDVDITTQPYPVDPETGFVILDGDRPRTRVTKFTTPMRGFGYYIPLGIVKEVVGCPSKTDIEWAVRTFKGWTKLMSDYKIVLDLNLKPWREMP